MVTLIYSARTILIALFKCQRVCITVTVCEELNDDDDDDDDEVE